MFVHSIQHGPNQAIYAAIKLIEEAQNSVVLSTYVLEGQSHAGVCLLNAIFKSKATKIKFLTNHYCLFSQKTLAYLQMFPCSFPNRKLKVKVWKHSFANSNHAKFVVADGVKCSLGGYNFQEAFFVNHEGAWNDLGIIVSSQPLAANLTSYFTTMWKHAQKVACIGKNTIAPLLQCPLNPTGRSLDIDHEIQSFSILTQLPRRLFLHHHKSQAYESIMQTLRSARYTIDILSPNVIDPCVWKLLTEVLQRGVSVRILTNYGHNYSESFLLLWQTERSFFCKQQSKHSNLRIRYVNGAKHQLRKTVLLENRKLPMYIDHSKYFNVDGESVYIGSFNLDAVSLHASGESGLILKDSTIASQMNTFLFEPSWQKATSIHCSL